jgi:uncharacterized membrane-anchored protein YitT (DUF2179 family)
MRKKLFTYFCLLFGATIQGAAMAFFLFPHHIPSGGSAGIAILMNHWFNLSLGTSLWFANAVFLLFALKYFGYTWTLRTILSVAVTSGTVNVITAYAAIPQMPVLFCILAGSLFFGVGVGILIRSGASSGGMVIPALMIAALKKWPPGKVMLGINLSVFLITALVIDYKIVFYAMICQFFSTTIIDFIYEWKVAWPRILLPGFRKR